MVKKGEGNKITDSELPNIIKNSLEFEHRTQLYKDWLNTYKK